MRNVFERYWHIPILIIAAALSLKIRVMNPWESVFTWTVRLGGNDPWYYYRLIENCIHNFPHRIWFDPFTHYPFGSYLHFGPFMVYLGAIAGIISGSTGGESLRAVLAFLPVVGGVLTILPIYLIGREVFDKRVGVIAAFLIAFIPGQFLQRTLLGFADHHAYEVLWMLVTVGMFTYSLNRWNETDEVRRYDLVLAAMTGVAFGLYIDTWAPGFVLALVIFASIYLALIFGQFVQLKSKFLPLTAVALLVAAIVYLPFAFSYPGMSTTHYSPFQLSVILTVAALILILWKIDERYEIIEKRIRVRKELFFTTIAVAGLIAMPTVFPQLYTSIATVLKLIQLRGGALTIAEVYPFFFTREGAFTLWNAYVHFGITFFLAVPGLIYAAYRIYRHRNYRELFLLVWAVSLFVALWGQNRFAYYFASVSALYCALFLHFLFDKLHFYSAVKTIAGSKTKFSFARVAIAILIAAAVIIPTYQLAEAQSLSAGGPQKQWYDALEWMRHNTPDGDRYDEYYLKLYPVPPSNKERYSYPFQTYGVMSWWDYGHWIEAIAHRMPIANPFQHGIGNKYNNVAGAAPFFTATNESYAEEIAEKLNVRYVVSDVEMATGKFYAMAVWAEGDLPYAEKYYDGFIYLAPGGVVGFARTGIEVPPNSFVVPLKLPSKLYYETVEAKLHIFDGNGLHHYRMIYESSPAAEWQSYLTVLGSNISDENLLSLAFSDAFQRSRFGLSPSFVAQEILFKYAYKRLYSKDLGIHLTDLKPSGYVKVFERVRGAVITGRVAENVSEVVVNVTVKTNQNRAFEYVARAAVSDGTYKLVVPYAQDTGYPVKPVSSYTIRAGDVVKTFNVTEEQVVRGEIVRVDLT